METLQLHVLLYGVGKKFENFEAKEMPVRSRVRPPTR